MYDIQPADYKERSDRVLAYRAGVLENVLSYANVIFLIPTCNRGRRKNVVKKMKKIVLYLFCILMTVFFIYPLYFIVISSAKSNTMIFENPFLPSLDFHLENFSKAWAAGIGRQFLNSLILALGAVVVTAVFSCMIAFALTRLRFKLQGAVRVYFVMGMMVPIQSIIVPIAFMTNTFELRDNYILLIFLYSVFWMPLSIFIITGFLYSIPVSLEEAAVIDGCSIYKVFFKIILPLIKPAVATASIFVFMYTWNELLTAMIMIGKSELRTISVGLLNFVGAHNSDYGALMAAILIAILPPFFMYLFMQENVVKGLTSGANK